MNREEVDLAFSEDGDLILDNDEISEVYDIDYIKQQVKIRIKTMKPDWFFDDIGSNLEELLGKPNSKDTAKKGLDLIRKALTYDEFLSNDDIYLKPVPVDKESILYFIFIKTPYASEPISFKANIALSAGINIMEVE